MYIFNYLNNIIDYFTKIIFYEIFGFPLLVLLLLFASIYFSIYLKFPNIKLFKKSLQYINEDDNENTENTLLKSKQSLFTSLSSVIGMGSIAGVATAICVGGAGSIFWLVIISFFSMNISFAETLLAIKYKNINAKEKTVTCAPINYIKNSLKDVGYIKLGIFLSVCYGIMYFFGLLASQMYQIEEVYNLLSEFKIFYGHKMAVVIIFDIIILSIIYGGITTIAKIFDKLLPLVCGLYIISSLIVLIINITKIPHAFYIMFIEAFKLKSITGGIIGAICTGIKRGIYSMEAGLGAATTPYTAFVGNDNPVKKASIGALNPLFVAIICLMTGLVIISSGVYENNTTINGIALVNSSFVSVFSWFQYILTIIILLLTISICISSTFNAQNTYNYFFGRKTTFIFICIQFLAITSIVYLDLNKVIEIGDTFYLSIAIPNIICLFLARKIIKNTYNDNL